MGRDVTFDFATGGGSDPEFLIGTVTMTPTHNYQIGDREVLPFPSEPVELVNGLGTLKNVAVSPDGPEPAWGYKVTVTNGAHGDQYGSQQTFTRLVGVPAGTGAIPFKQLTIFTDIIPPGVTGEDMQNWATTAQNGADRAEAAAAAATAPTDAMVASKMRDPESATGTALHEAVDAAAAQKLDAKAAVAKADSAALATIPTSPVAPVPAMQFTGQVGSISAPGAPFNVTEDLDVRALVSMDDWTPSPATGTTMCFVSRGRDGAECQFQFEINNNGFLIFRWSPTGSSAFEAKQSLASLAQMPNGASLWVRVAFDVNNGAGESEIFFYTSSDGQTWAQLGPSIKTTGVVKFVSSTDPIQIGMYSTATRPLTGRVSEVVVLDGIDGPTLGHFKAGVLPYTDPQGNPWELSGTGITLVQPPVSSISVLPSRANTLWQYNATSYSNPITEWGGYQFVGWWGTDRYLRIGKRAIGSKTWQVVSLEGHTSIASLAAQVKLDGHNIVALHADSDGYLHLAANMHGDWMRYARSSNPGDITSWDNPGMIRGTGPKTDTDEGLVTYPRFFTNPATGQMLFMYRNGASGNGNTYLNRYNPVSKTWTRVGLIFDGAATGESAYENTPVFDDAGVLHLSYTWAANGSGFNDREDVCYMKSADGGVTWTTITGSPVPVPVTHPTAPVILPATTGDGLLNQCGMAVDSKGYPHIAHFWAPDGNRNIWHLYWDGAKWVNERVTDFAVTGLSWTGLSRPAIIHYAGKLLVIWRHQYEGWRGKVWVTDVSVPGRKRHQVLVDADLREWEPGPDYTAVRRGSLNLLLTRTNAQVPEAIPGSAEANWGRQTAGVLTVDLARFDQRQLHRLPKDRPTDP